MTSHKKHRILIVFGTRPEALKLAPVILEAKKNKAFETYVCLTAQHREMVDQVLKLFKIKPDFDLNLMVKNQTLGELTQKLFPKIQKVFQQLRPDGLIVQGDTTTAFAVALQAFYERIPTFHIEAGLRSHNKYQPFPEEINRVLVSHVADYNFAPTEEARQNLLNEGILSQKISVTGNTVVDALNLVRPLINGRIIPGLENLPINKKVVLITAHRRESFGKPLQSICQAIRDLVKVYPDVEIVYPVHLNPRVQNTVFKELKGQRGIRLIAPLNYDEFLSLMNRSYLILTDSGGIQEEAPSFGKPVLVMREKSERPDGIRLGVAKLVGTSKEIIFREASRLIKDSIAYQGMVKKKNPYGDGKASKRIIAEIFKLLSKNRTASSKSPSSKLVYSQ